MTELAMLDTEEDILDIEPEGENENGNPIRRHNTTKLGVITPSQRVFAEEIVNGSGVAEAYRKAFPDAKESRYVHIYANRLIRNPKVRQEIELLQQAARMRFLLDAPRAAEKLIDLSKNAKSENVQLDATKDILNRGGLQPPQRVETVHVGIFGSASQDDIRNLLRNQMEARQLERKEEGSQNG